MIRRFFIGIALMLYTANAVYGQIDSKMPIKKAVNQSTLFGVGSMILTDTYLSPLEYNGLSLSIFHERLNATPHFKGKLLIQQQFFLQGASTDNPISNAKTYYGNVDYHLHGFYPIVKTNSFRLLAGAGTELSIGGIYNIRNSNNPAQLKTSINLNASMLAFYKWRLLTLRWQVTTPLIGAFFSPEYGQSYYEIFVLGNDSGIVHFALPTNQRGLRNYITADYPIGKITLRAGYLRNYYRTETNDLVTSISSHQFMIGLAFESLSFGRRDIEQNDWLKSVYNN
ncbi:MAG TPA: DUF3316 domain-containing protein [Dysgonamonadaceae bacterium]|nr:DUF3316 domain-containing protein [Dysgonamonadaceae bacterium]